MLMPTAAAQVAPPPGSNTDGRMEATYTGGRFTLTDNILHRPIFVSILNRLVADQQCTPRIQMIPRPGGCDLVFSYTNNTDRPLKMGRIVLPGLRLSGNVKMFRFRQDTSVESLSGFEPADAIYPIGSYSPVMVLQDERHIVGLSLLYKAVEFNHPVQMCISSPERFPGDNGQHWNAEFRFTHDTFVATIPAGQTRAYTVAVRAVARDQSWLKTLVPYRDFFRSTYGQIDYVKDPRPVVGLMVSASGIADDANPRGFLPPTLRPDIHGWGPWANMVRSMPGQGFNRVMLWGPSGTFRNHAELNFPSLFMSGMDGMPRLRESFTQLSATAGPNLSLGFWWGRSLDVMTGWDTGQSTRLDPQNPQHVRQLLGELDLAVQGGATLIGLDSYTPLNPGDGYQWIRSLRAHAAKVKFITESASVDIYHNITPAYRDGALISAPDVLADFINPGHETWAGVQQVKGPGGQPIPNPTIAQRQAEMRRLADLGYIPVIFGSVPVPPGLRAVNSSISTIPRDLLPGSAPPPAPVVKKPGSP